MAFKDFFIRAINPPEFDVNGAVSNPAVYDASDYIQEDDGGATVDGVGQFLALQRELGIKLGDSTVVGETAAAAYYGTYLYSGASATRTGEGEYRYFISTNSLDPLGIYYAVWKGEHDVGGAQGTMPIRQRDPFELVRID